MFVYVRLFKNVGERSFSPSRQHCISRVFEAVLFRFLETDVRLSRTNVLLAQRKQVRNSSPLPGWTVVF